MSRSAGPPLPLRREGRVLATALNWFEVGIVKRTDGHNVIARAAYNARERLVDERTNQVYDYRHLGEAEWAGIFDPDHAPDWAAQRDKLWNAVECREDKSTRPDQAQLARDFKIALPYELNAEQRRALVRDYAQELARKGMVVDVAIHAPHAHNDDRNFHAHMLLTMREIGSDGFGNKVRAWNKDTEFNQWMERWSELGAEHLERAGFKQEAERFRTGHLSRPERAKLAHDRGDKEYFDSLLNEPLRHRGPEVSGMENKGRRTRKGEINREIEERNRLRGVPREIREAYALSSDVHGFSEALERKNMMLARVTKKDARRQAAEFAFDDSRYVPQFREGEYLIATEQGSVYRLSRFTTGDSFRGIRDFTRPLDQQDCPSLEAARGEMKKRSLIPQIDRDTLIAEMMRLAPGTVTMIDGQLPNWLRENAPGLAAMISTAPGYDPSRDEPRTALPNGANAPHIRGEAAQIWWAYNSTNTPDAFHESLKERGLHLARVTAEDVLDSKTDHWAAIRQGRYHPILRESEYVVVSNRGFAYRLNERGLGHEGREVRAFMGKLDDKPIQSLRELRNAVQEQRLRQIDPEQGNARASNGRAGLQPSIGRIKRAAERTLLKTFEFVAGAKGAPSADAAPSFPTAQEQGERQDACVLPFAISLRERSHFSEKPLQKMLAIALGSGFIQHMVIRRFSRSSKLFAVGPRPAAKKHFRCFFTAQLGKDGRRPLPLHPSPMPPLAATETLPVSMPSRWRSAAGLRSWSVRP
jgi:hypothetical protein